MRSRHRPPLPPENILGTHLIEAKSTPRPQCGRKVYTNENSDDTIINRTRDLPACNTLPQAAAPSCAPIYGVHPQKRQWTGPKILEIPRAVTMCKNCCKYGDKVRRLQDKLGARTKRCCDLCIPLIRHFTGTESICELSRVQKPRPSALLICCDRVEGLNCQIYFTSGL